MFIFWRFIKTSRLRSVKPHHIYLNQSFILSAVSVVIALSYLIFSYYCCHKAMSLVGSLIYMDVCIICQTGMCKLLIRALHSPPQEQKVFTYTRRSSVSQKLCLSLHTNDVFPFGRCPSGWPSAVNLVKWVLGMKAWEIHRITSESSVICIKLQVKHAIVKVIGKITLTVFVNRGDWVHWLFGCYIYTTIISVLSFSTMQ